VSKPKIIIGTRGSELALWQSNQVATLLREKLPAMLVEIKKIRTTGDRILDAPLSKIGDKGLFTKELDNALLSGEIDIAVHSLKDIPTMIPAGLSIAAILEREDVRDVFIPNPGQPMTRLEEVPRGAAIATGSLRRRCQLLNHRPDLQIVEVRGNLNTRIEKLRYSSWHGMILAYAGVIRLGWKQIIGEVLPTSYLLPAVGQGAIGIITRNDNTAVIPLVNLLNHQPTRMATLAERAMLRHLEGGCQIPIGAHGVLSGNELTLHALVGDISGKKIIRDSLTRPADDPEGIGVQLGNRLLQQGADKILEEIRKNTLG
jgi:hydroxymethylbilane synthase